MSKKLNNLQDIKSAFISHCKELSCNENYIKVCENKFSKIENSLKALEIIKKKGLSMEHKELIIRSNSYEYYKRNIVSRYEPFKFEVPYEEQEYNLLKEALK